MPDEASGPSVMGYKNCYFGGHKASFVQLMFNNDKLYGGDIVLNPGRTELLNVYNSIVSAIAKKYNAPQKENCLYSYVTHPEQRHSLGTSAISAVWDLASGTNSMANARITAVIENDIIKISYRDGLIYEQMLTVNDLNDF